MPYELDREIFVSELRKIHRAKWPIQISCYLKKPEDIATYLDRPEVPPGNHFCYQQWSRMDVTPEGDVTPCILYPDLRFGNLRDQGVLEIWNSDRYAGFRRFRRQHVLPVCAKCNSLYLHDAKRKHL
jgi:radical SAM protein with 4Fe4S-binding SPASM domain